MKMNSDAKTIKNFLLANGIEEASMDFSPIENYENYKRFPNGNTTNEVENYTVYQSVTVRSKDIQKLTNLSKNVEQTKK